MAWGWDRAVAAADAFAVCQQGWMHTYLEKVLRAQAGPVAEQEQDQVQEQEQELEQELKQKLEEEQEQKPAWMPLTRGHRQHWSQRQQQQQAQQQQQPSQQPERPHSDRATIHDTVDVLAPPGSHPQLSEWRRVWELASAAYFNRQHRVLWWRILHGCVMCGAFNAYIGRATVEQACCPYACCSSPAQPQTISHMFLECPMAATVISWLCRLWQAMTGHLPDRDWALGRSAAGQVVIVA
ncbi:hypothetical protein ABBQ38_008751 [Trebouxia sp. C0009 RCD-2024]